MFEYEDEFGILTQFTQQDVDNRAKEKGLSTEEYLSSNPEVKPVKVEKTNDVAETGAPVASELQAPESGVSKLEDFSLDVPYDDTKDKHNWLTYDTTDPVTGETTQQKDYSLFDKSDSDAVDDLSDKYPGFEFETTIMLGDINSYNAVKAIAPNGEEIDIEFNIGTEYTAPDTRTRVALEKRGKTGLKSLKSYPSKRTVASFIFSKISSI